MKNILNLITFQITVNSQREKMESAETSIRRSLSYSSIETVVSFGGVSLKGEAEKVMLVILIIG